MSNGGMVQLLKRDGTWSNCFTVSYKTENALANVARKYKTSTRLVNRNGQVLQKFDWGKENKVTTPQTERPEGIKCAGCKEYHSSIQAVRDCQLNSKPTVPISQVMDQAKDAYLRQQAEEVQLQADADAEIARLEKERQIALQKLEFYQTIVKKGGYAAPGDDGKLRFYKITGSNKPGREDVRFIVRYSSDRLIPIRSIKERLKVLEAIVLFGVEESYAEYGKKMRHCGRCLKKLTDEVSRSHGIGPECWEILGHSRDEW